MFYKVAIQGISGCFHDEAARRYFSGDKVETIECESFHSLFESMGADPALYGIVAIENTIAGSLLQNHELLRRSNARIIGEYKHRISHVLCALPGQSIDQLTEANSHPMALQQCEEFLYQHPNLRLVEKFDTAGAAKEIRDHNMMGHAAVCSEFAARMYGLDVLQEGIETNKRNFTRFLIVADKSIDFDTKGIDKSSIEFTLPHRQGSLSAVLAIFSFYGINLSKIQSVPIIGREWEYRFYVDLTFEDYDRYRQSLEAVRPLTNDFRILGEYRQCTNPV